MMGHYSGSNPGIVLLKPNRARVYVLGFKPSQEVH